ncbi:acyl-CoA dehydrogenase [Arthrobacter sp. zg-Y916]|uniref:acyl-CoA dehydrogenase family protein n=1 Tax=Arthrobacter sp. zg-Y916 TaxID=2894190 RepID=UPI001E47AD0B|nr:acyl-CoA dehydrogenase [Arthrobacter sp. zg-Y916]MCC9194813.1 acyl-CoA dehydrogenase [Arthrobacter sp. zg-Y916]
MTGVVRLASASREPSTDAALADLASLAGGINGSAVSALSILKSAAAEAPLPGHGSTRYLWELLATLGAADLTAARVVEPHLDARAILSESTAHPEHDEYAAKGISFDAGSWGVFAAEASGVGLEAEQQDGEWTITGRKPWCSLADQLDYAVVTARTGAETRRAFAVDLRDPGVVACQGPWISRGLAAVDSAPVDFSNVPGVPVGADNWYLQRSGFAWGGMGVAAVWYGGAVGVARRLLQASRERTPDQIASMLMGQVDTALFAARTALASAALEVDAGRADGPAGAVLAARVRSVVAGAAERVLVAAAHGMGPGPLATEEEHARRVADLHVYIRQHHAERDDASLGSAVLAGGADPW